MFSGRAHSFNGRGVGLAGSAFTPFRRVRAPVYDTSATALFAAMSAEPNTTRKGHCNTLIAALKASGAWDLIDVLYVLAAHDQQAARLNWKNPGTLTASAVNAPAFVADRGYTGDGASSYLNTGYDPASSSLGMAQNSAHAGVFVLTTSALTGNDFGTIPGASSTRLRLRGRSGIGSSVAVSVTTGTSFTGTPSSVPHHIMGVRRDAANQIGFDNGIQNVTAAVASTGLPNTIAIGTGSLGYSDRQIGGAHAGQALSDGQALAVAGALTAYMQAVGAA